MRLTYCQIEGGNFGDDLNPWLWPRIAPGFCDDDANEEFLGIGTILADTGVGKTRRVVFGSGGGYKRPPVIDKNWSIYCVRGPRTARLLKIDPALAVTDPAALVASLPWPACEQSDGVSYMPHHLSAELGDWQAVCKAAGLHYIAANTADVATTIERIRRSKLLITEALHGAVVADAFRVPWIPVRAYGHILPLKWHDWCESLGLAYEPQDLPTLWQRPMPAAARARFLTKRVLGYLPGGKRKWRWSPVRVHDARRVEHVASCLAKLAVSGRGQLSANAVHQQVLERLTERLAALVTDYGDRAFSHGDAAA